MAFFERVGITPDFPRDNQLHGVYIRLRGAWPDCVQHAVSYQSIGIFLTQAEY